RCESSTYGSSIEPPATPPAPKSVESRPPNTFIDPASSRRRLEAARDHLTDACQLGLVEYWAAVSGEALPKTTVDAQSQFHSLPAVTLILSLLVACQVTRPRNSLYQLMSYAGRLRSAV